MKCSDAMYCCRLPMGFCILWVASLSRLSPHLCQGPLLLVFGDRSGWQKPSLVEDSCKLNLCESVGNLPATHLQCGVRTLILPGKSEIYILWRQRQHQYCAIAMSAAMNTAHLCYLVGGTVCGLQAFGIMMPFCAQIESPNVVLCLSSGSH